MKNTLIALAAVLMAALFVGAPQAQAGGGIRVGFGGPLPSFVARPSGGSTYSTSRARRYHAARCAKKKSYASRPAPRQKVAKARTIKQHLRERAVASTAKKKSDKVEEIAVEETPATETESTTETTATATTETTPASGEPAATTTATLQAEQATIPPTPVKKPDCKKFLPSVGLTITVPCT